VRVTTNAPISYVVDEIVFDVVESLYFAMMPDERSIFLCVTVCDTKLSLCSLKESLSDLSANYLEKTIEYWLEFSRVLSVK
jgi:hypothetical protein